VLRSPRSPQRPAAALQALSLDFAKARKPAAAGNFPAASKLMADRPVQLAIVRESQTIERGCR
jgi:hypothetical protein